MGVAWFGFSCGFVLLFLLIFRPGGEVVVTIDVHEAKDLIKSGYGYLDVRYEERISSVPYFQRINCSASSQITE